MNSQQYIYTPPATYSTVTINASNVMVTVTGIANTQFTVTWQMWTKIDSGSRLDDDSANNQNETIPLIGTWSYSAHGTGNMAGSANISQTTPDTHRAEVFASCSITGSFANYGQSNTFMVDQGS